MFETPAVSCEGGSAEADEFKQQSVSDESKQQSDSDESKQQSDFTKINLQPVANNMNQTNNIFNVD